ncbi:MAG: hypothetical protein AB7Q17_16210 [Phycisphaerae bacterium]
MATLRSAVAYPLLGLTVGIYAASAGAQLRPDTPSVADTIALRGAEVPVDHDGNRAVDHAARRISEPAAPDDGGIAGGGTCGLLSWTSFGPSGADTESVAASPVVSGLVLASVSSSVGGGAIYRSTNGGTSWTLASGTANRAVREVEFAADGAAWAATDDGLFRSTDGGATWTPVALPIAGQAVVRDVAVDPADPAVAWVGIGQLLNGTSPIVVLRTVTAGANWTDVSPPVTPGMGATAIGVDPNNPLRVFAAFTPNFGGAREVWVTTNGGGTWAERSAGLPVGPINDIVLAAGVAYLAGGQDFGSQFVGFHRSLDDGVTWIELSAAWPSRAATSIAFDPADASRVFVGTTRAGLAYSADGGANWSHSVGGTGTYQVNDIEFAPLAPATVFLGLGSIAVLRSTDAGLSFTASSTGISRLEISSFAVNPLNPREIAASYIGVNDGGIFVTTDAGATWSLSEAPLPRWLKVVFAPDGTLYGTHNGPLGRADDGLWRRNPDNTWTNLGPGSPAQLDTIGNDIAISSGANPVVLWAGYRWLPTPRPVRVWSYNRAAPDTWELEYEGVIANEQAYSVHFLNGGSGATALVGIVNFGTGAGSVFRSTDSGDTWNPADAGYPAGWNAWEIAPSPRAADTVYVAASPNTGMTNGSILKSIDAGASWIAQGSTPIFRYLAVDPNHDDTLYALAPFNNARPQRSINDGASFAPYDANFISTAGGRDIVHGGTLNAVRRLYVATSGGGYASDIPRDPPCPGDVNCDGAVNAFDIDPFVIALVDPAAYALLYPACQLSTGDVNDDGAVNSFDIDPFVDLLVSQL